MKGRVVFDYETTGLNPWKGARPFLLGLEDETGKVLLANKGTSNWKEGNKVLANPSIEKAGWNVKFDLKMAKAAGIPVRGKVHDAMLLTFMNDEYEPNLKLKDCAERHLGMKPDEETAVKKELIRLRKELKREPTYADLPKRLLLPYLEGDLDRTMKMLWKMEHVMTGPQRRVYEIERELIPNVVEIESWGVNIDVNYCKAQLERFGPRLKAIQQEMFNLAGVEFNQNSNPQLTEILQQRGIDTGDRNKDGSMKTGEDYLRKFKEDELVSSVLEFRSMKKIGTTYFEAFMEHQVEGVIHPSFWPFGQDKGIKTGRFSSSDPNFQNIPGGARGENLEMLKDPGLVRRAVVPRPGYCFVFGDYKQIEFVIFACNAGDEGILSDLRKGVDFHTANAFRIFGRSCMDGKSEDEVKRIRFQAKELNFSFIFGMGVNSYAHRAGLSMQEARARKARFFSEVPAARDFLMSSQADLMRDGHVQDVFGRRYHVPKELCYKAANALCQGPAALVMKRGINRTFERLGGFEAHPFITVHDELGVEVRKDQVYDFVQVLTEAMEDKVNFPVPINVDVAVSDVSWADKKKWKEVQEIWKSKRKRRFTLARR